jgi:hypothetical protein
MNLLFLHGPPAAGKLTVARELLRLIPGRMLDNHASIDYSRTLFDFGTPEFWRLVQAIRVVTTEQAAQSALPNLICTQCYSEPEDHSHFERLQAIVSAYHGRLMPVFLFCDSATLNERVGNSDRAERRKLTSREGLAAFMEQWNIVPVTHPDCLKIDTSLQPASESAQSICTHFRLIKSSEPDVV